jgi:hypothetical protein
MGLRIGTNVGAPIVPNDSADQYPAVDQGDVKGGYQVAATVAAMDAIPAWMRTWNMLCCVQADGNIYQLAEDLVTWNLYSSPGGGSTGPGSGGDSADITLISGNFGVWTPLGDLSGEMINTNFVLSYKSDLQAFPSRAITYVQGQFGLNAGFAGTTLLLGVLPANSIPANQIKKYFICQAVEMFLVIDTNGNVSLESKDGLNLPTTSGTPETQPYYLDIFFNPDITTGEPTTYTSTRTENFTRNNCASGYLGSEVSYSQEYTSTVSQAAADALAASDPDYETAGQDYANNPANGGTCTINPDAPTYNLVAQNNNDNEEAVEIVSIALSGPENPSFSGPPNFPIPQGGVFQTNVGNYTYDSISIKTGAGGSRTCTVNGVSQTSDFEGELFYFDGPINLPITITLT